MRKCFFSLAVLLLVATVCSAACGGGSARAGLFHRHAATAMAKSRVVVRTSSVAVAAPVVRSTSVQRTTVSAPAGLFGGCAGGGCLNHR